MRVATLKLTFSIPWANSLKDKRAVVRSLTAKLREKFHVSVAEVEHHDIHRTAVIGIACVGNNAATLDSVLNHILDCLETNSEAELTNIEREII